MKVLVTGVAGDIGSGIGRILKTFDKVATVVGCDIHDEHLGTRIVDACEIVPRADSPKYLDALRTLVDKWQLDAIIPTSEPELRALVSERDSSASDLPFVMASHKAMSIGFDKLQTAEFISGLGCPAPWTRKTSDGPPPELPCVLKSRRGAGSRNIYIVRDPDSVSAYCLLFPDYIWQEYMPDEHHEYTCGVYGCADGVVRSIVFRRRLAGGMTGFAELVHHEAISNLCAHVARGLDLRGSINIQLRLGPKGPMIFEINPRFSSTVVFRHKLGFQDVIWSLQEQCLGASTEFRLQYEVGTRMYRALDEVIDHRRTN